MSSGEPPRDKGHFINKKHVGAALEVVTRSRVVRRTLRPVTRRMSIPSRAVELMHVDRDFTVSIGDGSGSFRYTASDADAVGRQLYWRGLSDWEAESLKVFIPLARRARGFVDVGAFTGAYSLIAATVNPSLRCLAFEPVPSVHARLVQNIALNALGERVTAVPAAVSSEVGTTRFFIPDREMPDTSFLETSARRPTEQGRWHDVRTTTLADVVPDDFHVDLMKIDVEDAEGPVVEAMMPVIATHRPTILIEMLSSGSYIQAASALQDAGYRAFHLTDAGSVQVDVPVPDDVFLNFLFVP